MTAPSSEIAFQADDPDGTSPLDSLKPEALEWLEENQPDIITQFREGDRDEIPESVVEQMPDGIADQLPDGLVAAAADNPGLALVLIGIGVLSLLGAVWGAIKGFLKMAAFLGLIAAVAWYWFFAR
jgi:hypothetical protein